MINIHVEYNYSASWNKLNSYSIFNSINKHTDNKNPTDEHLLSARFYISFIYDIPNILIFFNHLT